MKTPYCPSLKKIPLSSIFYALSDPIRLEIIQALLEQDEISCGACKSPLSKSTMSHHFKVLRESGLIEKRSEGKVHYLSLRRIEIESRLPGLLIALTKTKGPI
jgi:DNA-binding transcriptional ArsR family regulator